MTLPTWRMRDSGTPSRRRFASASGLGVSSRSARASVTSRLISSGIPRSKERSPASTCAVRTPSFEATSVAAIVEFTSPTTTSQSGRKARRTGSKRRRISAVCAAWLPEPTSRLSSGAAIPSSSKKTCDIASS